MADPILFGGTEQPASTGAPPVPPDLSSLLGSLSWKFVTADATFATYDIDSRSAEQLREDIAHWAGRVWFHEHEMPAGPALKRFDLMALENEYRRHVAINGAGVLARGLTLEELWAAQQLHDSRPCVLLVAEQYDDNSLAGVLPRRAFQPDQLVWLLAAMSFSPLGQSFASPRAGFEILTTNGRTGHAVAFRGLNGFPYLHPRGDQVPIGWFSFHDPWPARSLLAPERGWGVRVLEDVTFPPQWLISPQDLASVIVGFLLPVGWLTYFANTFAELDMAIRLSSGGRVPLWNEEDDPDELFSLLRSNLQGWTPLTLRNLRGLNALAILERRSLDAQNLQQAHLELERFLPDPTAST